MTVFEEQKAQIDRKRAEMYGGRKVRRLRLLSIAKPQLQLLASKKAHPNEFMGVSVAQVVRKCKEDAFCRVWRHKLQLLLRRNKLSAAVRAQVGLVRHCYESLFAR
jgi:hypothetical protein